MKDLSYYLESFDISFTLIGLCETWAIKTNKDILNMPENITMNTVFDQIKKEEGLAYIYIYIYIEHDTI